MSTSNVNAHTNASFDRNLLCYEVLAYVSGTHLSNLIPHKWSPGKYATAVAGKYLVHPFDHTLRAKISQTVHTLFLKII